MSTIETSLSIPVRREKQWVTLAEGKTFSDLKPIVDPNTKLPSGTPLRVKMQFTVPGIAPLFDLATAENSMLLEVPDGLEIVEVWAEGGSTVYVEYRVKDEAGAALSLGQPMALSYISVVVGAIVKFLTTHWVKLAIGGVIFYFLVKYVGLQGLIDLAGTLLDWLPLLLIIGVIAYGSRYLPKRKGAT